jgi:hypothetical protein
VSANYADQIKPRKRGGSVPPPDAKEGVNEAAEDLKKHAGADKDVEAEAEEKKAKKGGRIKKHVGKIEGEKHRAHGGRAARKSGGSCEASPFSSARYGTAATGRKLEKDTMG